MNTLILDALSSFKKLPVFGTEKINSLEIINSSEYENETFERIILLQNGNIDNVPTGIKNITVVDTSAENILNIMLKEAKNSENIVVVNATNPFFDKKFIHDMFLRHKSFLADYTYAIGYPDGLVPTILSSSCLKQLQLIAKENEIDVVECKDYLFQLLSKEINSFDVETFVAPIDLRIKRISIGNRDFGELVFTSLLVEKLGLEVSYDDLVLFLSKHSENLFSTIYGMFIDITNKDLTLSTYVFDKKSDVEFTKIEELEKIIQEIIEINSKMKIVIGNKYEPLIHPEVVAVINSFISNGFDVIVETFGTELPENLGEITDNDKVTFVFKIDAQNENTYKTVHPGGNYKNAIDNYEKVKNMGFKTYFQVIRTMETESDIELLIKNKQEDILIKKYSSYCNMLADKKVVDLSPLERFECYHLRRELYLNSALDVYYCMYSDKKIGNASCEKLTELVNKQKNAFILHAQGQKEDFCRECDDYYTFNF